MSKNGAFSQGLKCDLVPLIWSFEFQETRERCHVTISDIVLGLEERNGCFPLLSSVFQVTCALLAELSRAAAVDKYSQSIL